MTLGWGLFVGLAAEVVAELGSHTLLLLTGMIFFLSCTKIWNWNSWKCEYYYEKLSLKNPKQDEDTRKFKKNTLRFFRGINIKYHACQSEPKTYLQKTQEIYLFGLSAISIWHLSPVWLGQHMSANTLHIALLHLLAGLHSRLVRIPRCKSWRISRIGSSDRPSWLYLGPCHRSVRWIHNPYMLRGPWGTPSYRGCGDGRTSVIEFGLYSL